MLHKTLLRSAFIALLALSGCAVDDSDATRCVFGFCSGGSLQDGGGEASNTFRCLAVPNQTNIVQNEPVAIHVQAIGGDSPYFIDDVAFSSFTTISRTYSNLGTQTDTVTIRDSLGNTSLPCSFTVNVSSDGSGGGSFACTIESGLDSPRKGQSSLYKYHVTGDAGSYHFRLYPDKDENDSYSLSKNLPDASGNMYASTNWTYNDAGPVVQKMVVTRNATGEQATCEKLMNIRDPRISVSVIPGTTAAIGSSFTLTIAQEDFEDSNLTYDATSSDNNITITPLANEPHRFEVESNAGVYEEFSVTVSGTSGTESDTDEIDLVFASTVGCTVTPSNATPEKNEQVDFQIDADNSEAITVLDIKPAGGFVHNGNNPVKVSWGSSGTKNFRVKARTPSGHCNGGDWITAQVEVLAPLTCSVATSPNPSQTWIDDVSDRPVWVTASPSQNAGSSRITHLYVPNAAGATLLSQPSDLQKKISFTNAGTYPITVTVEDTSTGRTANCTTYHTAITTIPNCTATFRVNGADVDTVRVDDPVRLRITSNLPEGNITVAPGGQVRTSPDPTYDSFPHTTTKIVYSNGGVKTATVTIVNPWSGNVNTCQATINVTPRLYCTMTGPTQRLLVKNSVRGGTTSDNGPAKVPYSVTFHNPHPPMEFKLNTGHGTIVDRTTSQSNYTAQFPIKYSGVFVPKVQNLTDADDIYPGNCAAPNPIHVNKKWNVRVTQQNSYHYWVKVCNNTNAYQTVWLTAEGQAFDLHDVEPNGGCRQSLRFTHNPNDFEASFKTLASENPQPTGLDGYVCALTGTRNCFKFKDI